MEITLQGTWTASPHDATRLLPAPDATPAPAPLGSDGDVMAYIADCERQDNAMLCLVLSAALATAVLALAGVLMF